MDEYNITAHRSFGSCRFPSVVHRKLYMGPSENVEFSIETEVPMDSDGNCDGNPAYPKCGPI